MKAPFYVIERMASTIYARLVTDPGASAIGNIEEIAKHSFEVAEVFAAESERRFQAARSEADTERAKKTLEEANKQ